MPEQLKDICLNCGRMHERALWGAACSCQEANVVHQEKCNGCDSVVGQITDDDFCGPEKIYCADCIDKARAKNADS
jgi:hypothetical protein